MKNELVPVYDRGGSLFAWWPEAQCLKYTERDDVNCVRDRKGQMKRLRFLGPGEAPVFRVGSYSGEGQSYSFEENLGDGMHLWALKATRFMPQVGFLRVMESAGAVVTAE